VVTVRDVDLSPFASAVFVGDSPHDLTMERVRFNAIGADALFASSTASGASITIRDSIFNQSSIVVVTDATVTLEHNSMPDNSGSTRWSFNSPDLISELRGNHLQGAPCQVVVNLGAGTHLLRENLFEQMSTFGCRAIQIGETATITLRRNGDDAPNRFVGNHGDLDVRRVAAIDATGVQWSTSNPCDAITLVAGASVRTDVGTCTAP
jgi:hypothetical protein